jgi:hypothetical protein
MLPSRLLYRYHLLARRAREVEASPSLVPLPGTPLTPAAVRMGVVAEFLAKLVRRDYAGADPAPPATRFSAHDPPTTTVLLDFTPL